MFKVYGKGALWIQLRVPSRLEKLGKTCVRFRRSEVLIAADVVCCSNFGEICCTIRRETVVMAQHCNVVS